MSAQLCSMVHIQTLNSCRHEPRQKQDCGRPISARVVIVLLQKFNSNPLNSQTDPLDLQLPLQQGCAEVPTWSRSPHCWYQRRLPGSCRRSPWLCWWRPPPRWQQSWLRFPWRRGHVLLQKLHPPPSSRLDVLPSHWVLTIKIGWNLLPDLLLPMSMITMLLLLCCLASSSHVVCVEKSWSQDSWEDWISHQVVESVSPGDVIDKQSPCCSSAWENLVIDQWLRIEFDGKSHVPVVRSCDRPKCFLARLKQNCLKLQSSF